MKSLILFLTLIIFFTTNAYSKEAVDCKNLKKFSIKAAMCKTKNATNAFKDKSNLFFGCNNDESRFGPSSYNEKITYFKLSKIVG